MIIFFFFPFVISSHNRLKWNRKLRMTSSTQGSPLQFWFWFVLYLIFDMIAFHKWMLIHLERVNQWEKKNQVDVDELKLLACWSQGFYSTAGYKKFIVKVSLLRVLDVLTKGTRKVPHVKLYDSSNNIEGTLRVMITEDPALTSSMVSPIFFVDATLALRHTLVFDECIPLLIFIHCTYALLIAWSTLTEWVNFNSLRHRL